MKTYFLETSFIINFLRDQKSAPLILEKLEGEFTSSFVCLAELYEGIYRAKNKKQAEKDIKLFFSGLSRVFAIDEEIAKNFGQIRLNLKKSGKVIEDLDILLAATCLSYNCTMLTYNPKHFQRINQLKILELA